MRIANVFAAISICMLSYQSGIAEHTILLQLFMPRDCKQYLYAQVLHGNSHHVRQVNMQIKRL